MKHAWVKGIGTRGAVARSAGLIVAALTLSLVVPAQSAEDPWAPGTNWVSLRAGYAKYAAENSPNGAAGYGFGYTRMLGRFWIFNNMSLGANVQHDLLGRYASAALVDVPFSAELDRHFLWSGGMRPYLGLGVSAHFLKGYRFPGGTSEVRGGPYLVLGGNVPVSATSMLGLDARAGTVSGIDETYIWSMKLNYSLVY